MPERYAVRGHRRTSGIALTFDDGPHPENTPRILDCLDHFGIKATFFVQGATAKVHPGIVKDAAKRGHRIGNHGYLHQSARDITVTSYVADILKCQSLLEDLLGTAVSKDFRPPYGHVTAGSLWAMSRHGFRTVFWSIDSMDSFVETCHEVVESVASASPGGSEIMLFHDDYAHTVQALPTVLENLKLRGCTFRALA